MYRRLLILVEGTDDVRFFEEIIAPLFAERYDLVEVREHSQMPKPKLRALLQSFEAMGADYLFVSDRDRFPCITTKKESLIVRHPFLKLERILIVAPEIEAWYFAGLSLDTCTRLGLPTFQNCDDFSKEQFNHLVPRAYTSRTEFMLEVIDCFEIACARERSSSFRYFAAKFHLSE